MSLSLALLAVTCCQTGPSPAARLLDELGVRRDVEAVLAAIASARNERFPPRRGELRLSPPWQPRAAREAELVTALEDAVRADFGALTPEAVIAGAARWAIARAVTAPPPRLRSLRDFGDVLEKAEREVRRALGSGRDAEALAGEVQELAAHVCGGTLPDHDRGRDALARVAGVDLALLLQQAATVVAAARALADPELRAELAAGDARPGTRGVVGDVLFDRGTPFGRMVVGGTGHNEYDGAQIAVIVDLGGDDVYRGQVAGAGVVHRLAMVVDLAGNDTYEVGNDSLGSASMGLGVVLDVAGDDHYRAGDRSAGFAAGGVGLLLDLAGDDTAELGSGSGGVALYGVGLWLDAGNGADKVTATAPALGVGMPGGLGCALDDGGRDVRLVSEGVAAAVGGCGAAFGLPGRAGGIGLLLDVSGDDRVEAPARSLAFARDAGTAVYVDAAGDDEVRGGAWSCAAAIELGRALWVDAAGADHYVGTGPAVGVAGDRGMAWFEDRAGVDRYELERPASAGWAVQGSLAAAWDADGDDVWTWRMPERVAVLPEADGARAVALYRGAAGGVGAETEAVASEGRDRVLRVRRAR